MVTTKINSGYDFLWDLYPGSTLIFNNKLTPFQFILKSYVSGLNTTRKRIVQDKEIYRCYSTCNRKLSGIAKTNKISLIRLQLQFENQ